MSTFSTNKKSTFTLYEENEVNSQFQNGQILSFYSEFFNSEIQGTVLKKYTNSCLVDISINKALNKRDIEHLNSRMIISYKKTNFID